jgi:hypothetical protein
MAIIGKKLRHGIFFKHARKQAIEELTTNGLGLIGMAHPAMSAKEATKLVNMIDDETLEHNLKDMQEKKIIGDLGDGKIFQLLDRFIQWIKDHKQEIIEFVKIILSIIAIFLML